MFFTLCVLTARAWTSKENKCNPYNWRGCNLSNNWNDKKPYQALMAARGGSVTWICSLCCRLVLYLERPLCHCSSGTQISKQTERTLENRAVSYHEGAECSVLNHQLATHPEKNTRMLTHSAGSTDLAYLFSFPTSLPWALWPNKRN